MCLAFVIFYIPDFLRGRPAPTRRRATRSRRVEGHEITAGEFRRTYQAQLQAYRSAYGGNMNEQLLKQLGVEQQILQQMVDERAALAEAERLGITVERRGSARSASSRFRRSRRTARSSASSATEQLLRMQQPADDAGRVRRERPAQLIVEKLRAALTDWMSVTDTELEQEYQRRNDKVKLAVVTLHRRQLPRRRSTATDADVAQLLRRAQGRLQDSARSGRSGTCSIDVDAHAREDRRAAGRRRARLQRQHRAVLDARAGARQPHPAQDRRQGRRGGEGEGRRRAEAGARPAPTSPSSRRNTRRTRRSAQERRRPRLLRPRPDGAGVRPGGVRAGAGPDQRSGEDAVRLSHHQGGRQEAGDDASRSPRCGSRSPISSPYERAQAQAADLATDAGEADQQAGRSRHGRQGAAACTVQESGFFARDEPILGLGAVAGSGGTAFEHEGRRGVGGRCARRAASCSRRVAGKQDPYVPKLDEVKDRVRDEVIKQKARDAEPAEGGGDRGEAEGGARLREGGQGGRRRGEDDRAHRARRADSRPRRRRRPSTTRRSRCRSARVSDPIADRQRHGDRQGAREAGSDAGRAATPRRTRSATSCSTDRRNRFFSAYMAKAKQKMKIDVNREALQRVVG